MAFTTLDSHSRPTFHISLHLLQSLSLLQCYSLLSGCWTPREPHGPLILWLYCAQLSWSQISSPTLPTLITWQCWPSPAYCCGVKVEAVHTTHPSRDSHCQEEVVHFPVRNNSDCDMLDISVRQGNMQSQGWNDRKLSVRGSWPRQHGQPLCQGTNWHYCWLKQTHINQSPRRRSVWTGLDQSELTYTSLVQFRLVWSGFGWSDLV